MKIFKKDNTKIFQYAKQEEWLPNLDPVRMSIPSWWKESELWIGGIPKISNYSSNKGLKACIPFLDSMLYGYTVNLWTDCMVEINDGVQSITWMNIPDPISHRNKSANDKIPTPAGCSSEQFTWNIPYFFKTPKDYSLIMTHPFNRDDLPFSGLTGLVDSDSVMSPGQYPFFLKEGFKGIIKSGTPIVQIIPIKRDNWKAKENKDIIKESNILKNKSSSVISGFYKKNIHKQKSFK